MSQKTLQSKPGSLETLEIRVFESINVGYPTFLLCAEAPELMIQGETGFTFILDRIQAIAFASRPPPGNGIFVINPRPALI